MQNHAKSMILGESIRNLVRGDLRGPWWTEASEQLGAGGLKLRSWSPKRINQWGFPFFYPKKWMVYSGTSLKILEE